MTIMKLRYFIPTIAAALTMMVGCSEDNDPHYLDAVRVSSSYVSLDVNGGSTSIKVTANGDWAFSKIFDQVTKNADGSSTTTKVETPSWLKVSQLSGSAGETEITFTADKTLDGRNTSLQINCGGKTQEINVIQGLSTVSNATCKEVIDGPDSKTYRVTGTCTAIANTSYGNWYLTDETGQIYIYGTLDKAGKEKNFLSLGIEVGDIVTVQGPRKDFNGTIELVDVTVINIEKGSTPEPVIEKINVAKALEIINGMEDGKTTENEYDIEGYIVYIKEVSPKVGDSGYGNATYDINDEAGKTENALTVFRGHYLDDAYFTAEDQIAVGEKVVVRGKLQRYVKNDVVTPEVAQNNYIVSKDTSTSISQLTTTFAEANAAYNLNGQRVLAPQKGLYIINGKKVVK